MICWFVWCGVVLWCSCDEVLLFLHHQHHRRLIGEHLIESCFGLLSTAQVLIAAFASCFGSCFGYCCAFLRVAFFCDGLGQLPA